MSLPPCQPEGEGEHSPVPKQVVVLWPISTLWFTSWHKPPVLNRLSTLHLARFHNSQCCLAVDKHSCWIREWSAQVTAGPCRHATAHTAIEGRDLCCPPSPLFTVQHVVTEKSNLPTSDITFFSPMIVATWPLLHWLIGGLSVTLALHRALSRDCQDTIKRKCHQVVLWRLPT